MSASKSGVLGLVFLPSPVLNDTLLGHATELSPIVTVGFPDYINEETMERQIGHKAGKVGHPIPGVAVKIVDPDTFEIKGYDEEGFFTNDPGTLYGKNYYYSYQTIMNSAHDWNGSEEGIYTSPSVALIISKD